MTTYEARQEFLGRYKLRGVEFLRSIVTGDETWMHMGGRRFLPYEKVKGKVEKWTKVLMGNYLKEGIKK